MDNVNISLINNLTLDRVKILAQNYLSEGALLVKIFNQHPNLCINALNGDEVIGVCYGLFQENSEDKVVLQGIAVDVDRFGWNKGVGKKMLQFFELQAKNLGAKEITLGSADDDNTERFYDRCGYEVESIRLTFSEQTFDLSCFDKKDVLSTRTEGEEVHIYLKANKKYNQEIKKELKKKYKTNKLIIIFKKHLTD